jgi:hypothetical protein
MTIGTEGPTRPWRDHLPLALVTTAAVLVGLFMRFFALGHAPLEVDEYYSARAVQDILRVGIPAYDCGGFYERGLIFHYLAALFQGMGLAELGTRTVAVLSSLIALPAVFLLGKRAHSVSVGLLAVCLVSLSIWEIELSRYGRMYAPFQAVFLWYAVVFLDRVLDREERPLWPLFVLSIVGFLVWEGGFLLGLTNFLPVVLRQPNGRWPLRRWVELVIAAAIVLAMFTSLNIPWRLLDQPKPWPDELDAAMAARIASMGAAGQLPGPLTALLQNPGWAALGLVPLVLAAASLPWIWGFRARWPAAVGLLATLCAALLHQFALVASAILVLLLMRVVQWSELTTRAARFFLGALLASFAFWVTFGFVTQIWGPQPDTEWLGSNRLVLVLYELFRLPNVVQELVRPWSNAAPIMGAALLVFIALATFRSLRAEKELLTAERVLLVLLIVLLLAAASSAPPRHETRYVYFLYPVALIVAIGIIARLLAGLRVQIAAPALAAIVLVGFALTDDFRPARMLQMENTPLSFRLGEVAHQESQFFPIVDVRAAAGWLREHAEPGRDLLVNAHPSVDFYFPSFDFSYVEWTDIRFVGYACHGGTVERWSNLPLLYTKEDLQRRLDGSARSFLVVGRSLMQELLPSLDAWHPKVVWTAPRDTLYILELTPRKGPSAPTQTSDARASLLALASRPRT